MWRASVQTVVVRRAGRNPGVFEVDGVQVTRSQSSLRVPENRSTATSRSIELPVIRFEAINPSGEPPIYYLAGGPGMSNLGFGPPLGLLARHDVVLVGYRGVDGDVVLDAPEVRRAIRGVGGELFSEESRRCLYDAVAACAARLRREGVDIDGYTIPEVAADLDAARTAQGDSKIHLLSESYGTRVAQHYADRFPEHIARSIMVGVNPPGRFVWDVETIDNQLGLLSELYAARHPEVDGPTHLIDLIQRVNANMPRRWKILPINQGKVRVATFAMLFNRDSAALAVDAYVAADCGDPSGLAALSLLYDLVFPRLAVWGDFFAKGCSADADAAGHRDDWASPGGVMGSPLSELVWAAGTAWPAMPIGDHRRSPRRSQVETLLVGGNLDFSTPPDHTTSDLLPALDRGRQIVLTDMGHTTDFWRCQPEAAVELLAGFFADGSVNEDLFGHKPMSFDPRPLSLQQATKLTLGSATLAVIGLIAAARHLAAR